MTQAAPNVLTSIVLAHLPGGPRDGHLVAQLLIDAGIDCRVAATLEELVGQLAEDTGAVMLAEEGLDGAGCDALLSFLGEQPAWSDLPVILLSSVPGLTASRPEAVQALQSAGTVTFIERPVGSETLLAGIRAALRARQRQYEVRDLTLHLEEIVSERTRKLEAVIEELNAFSYTVAHDLRAPVRAITSLIELVLSDFAGKVLSDEGVDLLKRARDSGKRMDVLILDLLEYARLARKDVDARLVSLDELVSEILAHGPFGREDASSRVKVRGPLGRVLGHRLMLNQILTNLLSNALKFVVPGALPEVRIESEIREDRLRLWIHDKGIGIPAGSEGKVFGIFERLHPQDYPGTGMGLAIVKRAVTRMNGSVGFVSTPGQGSSFWIELPREGSPSSSNPGRRPPSRVVRRAE